MGQDSTHLVEPVAKLGVALVHVYAAQLDTFITAHGQDEVITEWFTYFSITQHLRFSKRTPKPESVYEGLNNTGPDP